METVIEKLRRISELHRLYEQGGGEEMLLTEAADEIELLHIEIEMLHIVLIELFHQIDISFFTSDVDTKEAEQLIEKLERPE